MPENAPNLRPDYYVRNFEIVLAHVRQHCQPLLIAQEIEFIETFFKLPEHAKRIYVRMICRTPLWFRSAELSYQEIENIPEALRTLEKCGFAAGAQYAEADDLIPLLRKPELVQILQAQNIPCQTSLKREALEDILRDHITKQLTKDLRTYTTAIAPLHAELLPTFLLLFFGNLEQSLTDIVLNDMGMVKYEPYSIPAGARLFETRAEVEFLLTLAESRETFETLALEDSEGEIEEFAQKILTLSETPSTHGQRRFARLLCDVGRELERRECYPLALACFEASGIPPSRERTVRIFLKQERTEDALTLAEIMAESPLEIQEEQFASTFIRKLKKKNARAQEWSQNHPLHPTAPGVHLQLKKNSSVRVEELVLAHAREQGYVGFFAENVLWCGLLGLALWKPLFSSQPDAFIHPFQDAPTDIGQPHFYTRRKEIIDQVLEAVASDPNTLIQTFDLKQNIANRFVNWRQLTRDMVVSAVSTIPTQALVAILSRMALNPFRYDSGFPDLFLVRSGTPEFWEVKGPGDSIRPEQDYWIREIRGFDIEAKVVWVQYN
jgi:hypothetical protein